MQLKWLEDFLHLAETRSFTRASEARHVTHPAFGRRIRALELWAGTALVDRSTYPLTLTPEGLVFLEEARKAVRLLSDAREQIRHGTDGQRCVVIACGRTLSRTVLPGWLMALHAQLKPFQARVTTGSLHDSAALLEQGAADFMLCYWHPQLLLQLAPDTYEFHTIGVEQLIAVSAPAPAKRTQPRHRFPGSARAPVPYLAYAKSLVLGRVTTDYLAHTGNAYHLTQVHEADFAESLLELVRAGLGVAWLPRRLVEDDLGTGALLPADAPGREIRLELRLYRRRTPTKRIAQEIWEAARND